MTCLRCGKIGHRASNCPDKAGGGPRESEAAPFVCYAELEKEGPETAWTSQLSTSAAVQAGLGVLDGGATRTLGSVQALESLMLANQKKHGTAGVPAVDTTERPTFGFGNLEEARCISTAQVAAKWETWLPEGPRPESREWPHLDLD